MTISSLGSDDELEESNVDEHYEYLLEQLATQKLLMQELNDKLAIVRKKKGIDVCYLILSKYLTSNTLRTYLKFLGQTKEREGKNERSWNGEEICNCRISIHNKFNTTTTSTTSYRFTNLQIRCSES